MTNKGVLAATLGALAAGAAVAWRLTVPPAPAAHVAVLVDRSGSATGGCPALLGAVSEALTSPSLSRRSSVFVLATGDAGSAGEPAEIARLSGLASGRAVEGTAGVRRRRDSALASVAGKCSALSRSDSSPILLGVARAAEALRARGCVAGARCRLVVVSDLEENVDEALAARIRGGRPKAAAARIDNAGIEVAFCGISETKGPSDAPRRGRQRSVARAGRLRDAWRAVFTEPGLVRFEPHCPRLEGPTPDERPAKAGDK